MSFVLTVFFLKSSTDDGNFFFHLPKTFGERENGHIIAKLLFRRGYSEGSWLGRLDLEICHGLIGLALSRAGII